MKLYHDVPSLFQSNVGPENQSRIYIAIEPAQLLKGDIMVSVMALPLLSQESMEREKQAHLKAVASDPAPRKPVRRMESSLYLKEIGGFSE